MNGDRGEWSTCLTSHSRPLKENEATMMFRYRSRQWLRMSWRKKSIRYNFDACLAGSRNKATLPSRRSGWSCIVYAANFVDTSSRQRKAPTDSTLTGVWVCHAKNVHSPSLRFVTWICADESRTIIMDNNYFMALKLFWNDVHHLINILQLWGPCRAKKNQ